MNENKLSLNFTIGVVRVLEMIFTVLVFNFWYVAKVLGNILYVDGTFTKEKYLALVITFYVCAPLAALVLYNIDKLLCRIKKGEVFTDKNTKAFRLLSYLCIAAVPLSVPLCFYFGGAVPIPCAAGFVGLLMRVMRNVFVKGCEIKDENDLTV